jgi:hypothetical protein
VATAAASVQKRFNKTVISSYTSVIVPSIKIDVRSPVSRGSDLVDPQEGLEAMGNLLLQEIEPKTKTVLFEVTMSSGYYKNEINNGEGYRYDITSFRVYKMELYP